MEIRDIEPFLDYYAKIRERTRRVVALIPPDGLEWAPREGAWSFGDLVRHLGAIERWMFAENVSGRPSRYPGHGTELADGYEAVLAYFDRMHAESMDLFRALTPQALQARCTTPGGASMPAWKWLRAMVEHEIHHRGQIYLMLGMIGVATPPLYGLTSEEVKARSAAA
ncbi:DinB family protein [Longimicrobium sp.]|uniref:DinB family protein n=1 Tax=Longimicrobium sp. TaxID=2029185 RepID=UPI003B3A8B08